MADGFAWYEWIYYPTWSRLDGLLMGVILGAIYELRPALRERLLANGTARLALAAVLWLAAAWVFDDPQSLWASVVAFPAIAIVYGLLMSAALSPSSILARSSSRVTEWLATLSYALYLTHKACIHVAQSALAKVGIAADSGAMFVACANASLLVALALHLAVERPFLQWRDRVLRTRRVGVLGRVL